MPVNTGLADLSNVTLVLAVGVYALAMFCYAGDFAFGTRAVSQARLIRFPALADPKAAGQLNGIAAGGNGAPANGGGAGAGAAVLAGGGASRAEPGLAGEPPAGGLLVAHAPAGRDVRAAGGPVGGHPGGADAGWAGNGSLAEPPGQQARQAAAAARTAVAARWPQGTWMRAAFALTCTGLLAQLLSVLSRGLAEHRTPWGNMYEFIAAVCCMTVIVLIAASVRFRAYYMGLFVLLPVVIALALDVTVVYTPAGQLVPALQSYWIAIHVTAMILAIGLYMFGAVVTVMYLLAERYERRSAAGSQSRYGGILDRLPGAITFDRLSYRSIMFAFPIWMFGIFAGAMWANEAWGRPWGWDPKETWSLITLIVYAAFLHARATAGWRGRRAAYVHLLGFACLLFNVIFINLWVHGLHSYAGLN